LAKEEAELPVKMKNTNSDADDEVGYMHTLYTLLSSTLQLRVFSWSLDRRVWILLELRALTLKTPTEDDSPAPLITSQVQL